MSIYDTLNDKQREAVLMTEGPLLILAGAGSGKTRVLTHRTAYLIEEMKVAPWNIMAITFTNKAANEMRERITNLLGYQADGIWVRTFHSSCVMILRKFIDRIGFSSNFSIYDTDDQKTVLREVCKKLKIDTKIYKEKMFLREISKAKDEFISPAEYIKESGQDEFAAKRIAEVYDAYQKRLKENNALDFDDIIVKTIELLRSDAEVLEYYQEKFKYIMVDEYQDTNTVQFMLISLLAKKYNNLCVVGDDDQSIYKFRGANIYNILNFEKAYPNARVIKLEQNYRSTKTILAAANSVIHNNSERKDKSLWTENPEGEKIDFREFENAFEEATYVAEDIKSKVASGKLKFSDCAILYRTNAQSRLFEEKFINLNLPYKLIGGVNFYSRKEIKDVLAYLKTIANGNDNLAVRRIINVPKRGIGNTTIGKVNDFADSRGISFYDALKDEESLANVGKASTKLKPFVDLIEDLRNKEGTIPLKDLIDELLERTGYIADLRNERTDEALTRIENIEEFINKAVDYEENAEEPSLGGFIEEVALVADIDSYDDATEYVVFMTLHGAKGLEFKQVYLAGMEDGTFPGYFTINSGDTSELEEERRLCYVGITRAREFLAITSAKQRMVHGETKYCKRSRFVNEIPIELMKEQPVVKQEKVIPIEGKMKTAYAKAKAEFKAKPFESKQFKVNKAEGLSYVEGDTVKHLKFGLGTVLNIVDGGRDYEVTVDFQKSGVKKMFASFAKLKKV
ncbi:DNA helicase-2 / ATP-dependent DNA helicase PcrA [Acetitomaculum ruminis DSM 5522]|uniref:ATP-dependent DNA helicase n=1 Tax=Acetitomaculum ruminis DSM 5522 TaxID=1120918 RepID=A0A1I1A6J9_9FIRM|nr:DNA helicase PcrA [Acetitomaculum ruminis]SFB33537.1 DNA helicase-2 / ATP-dependent DNA helicase PcrA [Acetitomaculum ruminis DSM 5522]